MTTYDDLPPQSQPLADPNSFETCPHCHHKWHGLPCKAGHYDRSAGFMNPCSCQTAWKDPAA